MKKEDIKEKAKYKITFYPQPNSSCEWFCTSYFVTNIAVEFQDIDKNKMVRICGCYVIEEL